MVFALFIGQDTLNGVFLPEKLGEICKLLSGLTSCLDAGGTLATPLNSNYACMGLPPGDMIGILTQTNIQNRIREDPNKRRMIQRCSCVISFTTHSSGLRHSGIQSPCKVFCAMLFFFSATFP